MKPLAERLKDRLEQAASRTEHQKQGSFLLPKPENEQDPEIEELVSLARSLQAAPQLQMAPDFVRLLERRMLRHHTELQLKQARRKRPCFLLFRVHPAFGAVLGLCLLFLLLSASVLVSATQVSNPTNPLYGIKLWEQHLQVQFSSNARDRTTA
jgi:hypothetical protein